MSTVSTVTSPRPEKRRGRGRCGTGRAALPRRPVASAQRVAGKPAPRAGGAHDRAVPRRSRPPRRGLPALPGATNGSRARPARRGRSARRAPRAGGQISAVQLERPERRACDAAPPLDLGDHRLRGYGQGARMAMPPSIGIGVGDPARGRAGGRARAGARAPTRLEAQARHELGPAGADVERADAARPRRRRACARRSSRGLARRRPPPGRSCRRSRCPPAAPATASRAAPGGAAPIPTPPPSPRADER